MAGISQSNLAGAPVPEQGISTDPATVETTSDTQETGEPTTEVTEGQEDPEKPPKTFTQEELDRIVAKERAKAERRAKRELSASQQAPQPQIPSETLTLDHFDGDVEAYVEAKAQQKAFELSQQQQVYQQRSQIDKAFDERVDAAMEKYDDWEAVATAPTHDVTPEMAETIKMSEVGPEIAYWLGLHPEESNRIATLHPLLQARELGKIEAKLASEPLEPKKKTSSAPAPINPVTARGSSSTVYDTTDPRSTKHLSDSEWIRLENERVAKKFQAR